MPTTWSLRGTSGGMLYACGDHDVNDQIVGFDFTSNAGQGWLQ